MVKVKGFFLRKKMLALSNRPTDIRIAFEKVGSDVRRATEASFECALLISKAKKPNSIGERLIKLLKGCGKAVWTADGRQS